MSTKFLQGYESPKSSNKFFRKFEDGQTKVRFLIAPIFGWVLRTFDENNIKTREDYWKYSEVKKQPVKVKECKHFWGAMIYNHNEESIQYWEITQKSIINGFTNLGKEYDLLDTDVIISKSGKGKEVKYSLLPAKESIDASEAMQELLEMNVNLDLIWEQGSPYIKEEEQKTEA